jgi:hypothetical protein
MGCAKSRRAITWRRALSRIPIVSFFKISTFLAFRAIYPDIEWTVVEEEVKSFEGSML